VRLEFYDLGGWAVQLELSRVGRGGPVPSVDIFFQRSPARFVWKGFYGFVMTPAEKGPAMKDGSRTPTRATGQR
jgi:hypothetical protein